MGRYGKETTVTVDKSIAELMGVVRRYGAKDFGIFNNDGTAGVMFVLANLRIKMVVKMPMENETRVNKAGATMGRTQASQAHEKAIRQRWRALVLMVKAKLEAVESGIETVEEAFMPYLMLPNGSTIGEVVLNQIGNGTLPLLGMGEK